MAAHIQELTNVSYKGPLSLTLDNSEDASSPRAACGVGSASQPSFSFCPVLLPSFLCHKMRTPGALPKNRPAHPLYVGASLPGNSDRDAWCQERADKAGAKMECWNLITWHPANDEDPLLVPDEARWSSAIVKGPPGVDGGGSICEPA